MTLKLRTYVVQKPQGTAAVSLTVTVFYINSFLAIIQHRNS